MRTNQMGCIDKSGQPRSTQELEEALAQVEITMVKDMLKIPPNLAVYMGVIRAALKELIQLRELIEQRIKPLTKPDTSV